MSEQNATRPEKIYCMSCGRLEFIEGLHRTLVVAGGEYVYNIDGTGWLSVFGKPYPDEWSNFCPRCKSHIEESLWDDDDIKCEMCGEVVGSYENDDADKFMTIRGDLFPLCEACQLSFNIHFDNWKAQRKCFVREYKHEQHKRAVAKFERFMNQPQSKPWYQIQYKDWNKIAKDWVDEQCSKIQHKEVD